MAAHVLIIDDDAAVRDMFAFYLRARGYRVSSAQSGEEGLNLCRAAPPDLVLSDLRMPGMDGHTVLAELSANFPDLPVIIVSGTAELGDAVQALRLGAWDYVTKPVADLAALDVAIDRSLERARLIAENRAYRENLEAANARLERSLSQLQEDETAGRRIQFTLLPASEARFGPIECSHFLRTSSFLSGDFVDYFTIDDARFAFYIADVAGHGVPSAVITVMLKNSVARLLENFRRSGDDTIAQPARLLAALNAEFSGSRHGKHLTMFYGVIDEAAQRLVAANAGQFPYPLLYDGETVRELGGPSPAVGMFDEASYQAQELPIGERFALFAFSDGVLERLADRPLPARKAKLVELATNDRHGAPAVAAALGLDTGEAPPDDASILVLRRTHDDD